MVAYVFTFVLFYFNFFKSFLIFYINFLYFFCLLINIFVNIYLLICSIKVYGTHLLGLNSSLAHALDST